MFTIDFDKYENTCKVATRNEYNKYIMTVLERNLNKVFGSAVFNINFDGEDTALNTIKDALMTHYKMIFNEFGEIKSVELSARCLLNALENEDREDEYHEAICIPLTDFRARKEGGGRLFYDMPKFVDVHFHMIDGEAEYLKDVKRFEEKEVELLEIFEAEIMEKTKLSPKLFKFLTKGLDRRDRTRYMSCVIEDISEYLEAA